MVPQVDYETDAAIQAALRAMPNTCTVLTIAHRYLAAANCLMRSRVRSSVPPFTSVWPVCSLDTIMDYDRVLVMDAGRAAEFAEPKTLMQDTSSRFYGLVSQMHGAANH